MNCWGGKMPDTDIDRYIELMSKFQKLTGDIDKDFPIKISASKCKNDKLSIESIFNGQRPIAFLSNVESMQTIAKVLSHFSPPHPLKLMVDKDKGVILYREEYKDLAKKAFDTQLIMNERLKNENELLKLEPELYGKDAKKAYELKQRIDGTKRTLYSCELYGKILHYPEQEIIDFKLKVIKMKTDAEEELSKLTAKPVRLDNQEWLYNIDKAAPNSKYTLLINEEDEREVLASKLITSMVEALGHTIVIKHDPDLVLDSRQSSVSSPESDPQSLEESTDDDAERRSLNCR